MENIYRVLYQELFCFWLRIFFQTHFALVIPSFLRYYAVLIGKYVRMFQRSLVSSY